MPGYRCIVADPPWTEHGGGGRGAQNHYPLLRTPEIANVIMDSPARDGSHLWLWVTNNYLRHGLGVMEALGYRYLTNFVWVKVKRDLWERLQFCINEGRHLDAALLHACILNWGLGQYMRGGHELCLLGVTGDAIVPMPEHRPRSVLLAPRGKHSAKPDEAYTDRIELISPGPRLELFARAPREGWEVWGNEV